MALVKFGGGVAAISGKVAGTVYARNKSGAYMRNWAKPTNTPSESQVNNRARFASQSAAWSALDSTNKSSWESTAAGVTRVNRFGEPYVPTGRQIYLESNNNLASAGKPPVDTPSIDYTPPAPVELTGLNFESTAGVLTAAGCDAFGVDASVSIVLECCPIQSDSKNNVTNLWRQVAVFTGTAVAVDFLADFIAMFGSAADPNQVGFARIKTLNLTSGLMSTPSQQTAIVSLGI